MSNINSINAITAKDESILDDLEALLANEFEGEFEVVEDEEDEDGIAMLEAITDEESDETTKLLEMEEAKVDAYEAQEGSAEPSTEEIQAKKSTKKIKAAKEVKTPRVTTAGMKPAEALRKRFGTKVYDTVVLQNTDADLSEPDLKETVDNNLAYFDTLAKKVGEKIVNLFQHISGDSTLSVYTQIALTCLKETGETTGSAIKQAYLDHPYKVGTASAQSSQMMTLLPALGLATRIGNKLIANQDSALLPLLNG